jgi:hypothetical protein
MSGKSPPNSKSRAPSWLSRHFKGRARSPLSPSSPASPAQLCSRLPGDSTGSVEVPADRTDKDVSPVSVSHRPSISSVSVHSTANSIPAHPSPSLYPSPSSPCHQHLPMPSDDVGKLDTPGHPADTAALPPVSPSHHLLVPSASISSTATTIPAPPPPSVSPYPQASPPSQRSPSSSPNSGKLDTSTHYAGTERPPAFTSHPPSFSSASIISTPNSAGAASIPSLQYPTHHLENSTSQNYSSMYLALPTPPPLSQGQVSNYQGPSVSVLLHVRIFLNAFVSATV